MNKFAVMSYSFHGLKNIGAINIFGYLETVKYRYDLDTADIWNGMLDSYDDKYIQMVKDNIDERGLSVVNFCCDECHIWDDDEIIRKENEEKAWLYIETAKKLGAKSIRIDAGIRDDIMPEEKMDYVAKKYEEYCAEAGKFGAKLGPENHWGGAIDYNSMEKLFKKVKAPNFAILLHLGNWNGTSDEKDKYDNLFADRAMHIHIDYEHCIDADRVIPVLVKSGYTGCWTVESHKSTNEYNNVAFQLAQLRRVVTPYNYHGNWKVAPPSVVEGNKEDKI